MQTLARINFKSVVHARSETKDHLRIMDTAVISDHYYNIVKRVSSLAGQWPYQKPKTRLLCVGLVSVVTFSMNVPQVKNAFFTITLFFRKICSTMYSAIF